MAGAMAFAGGCGSHDAAPGCAAPALHLGATADEAKTAATPSPSIPRDQLVYLAGERFSDRCFAASGQQPAPLQRIRIYLVQGDAEISVGQVDASADETIAVPFGIPPEIQPGPATVVAKLTQAREAPQLATTTLQVV
jgi:hypothetical protein